MKIKKKKIKQPMLSIFPITRTIKYNSSLNPYVIKKQLVNKMLDEILLATSFDIEEQGDGTTLMIGRLDIVKTVTEKKEDVD